MRSLKDQTVDFADELILGYCPLLKDFASQGNPSLIAPMPLRYPLGTESSITLHSRSAEEQFHEAASRIKQSPLHGLSNGEEVLPIFVPLGIVIGILGDHSEGCVTAEILSSSLPD